MTERDFIFKTQKGLSAEVVKEISDRKNEPGWMTDFRLEALHIFYEKKMPTWGADLSKLLFHDITYYLKAVEGQKQRWEDVPEKVKKTFDDLGILKAEQKVLAGVGAQYESEMIYKQLKKEWRDAGVVFVDISDGLKNYESIFKTYFASIIPANDNKFAALNSAVWSGGSFILVPRGVKIDLPLQAYFRINSSQLGQFERTLIIAQPGSFVHYVEGCSAPLYQKQSLHSAVVELVALSGAHIRYTTIQNWATDVYNLVTKRAIAHKDARVEWIDGNFGSKVTMKYPCVILKEEGAKGTIISLAMAKGDQHQDSGAKVIHLASHTTSSIIAKSISVQGGKSTYRGLVKVVKRASGVTSSVQCDALLVDDQSVTETFPIVDIQNGTTSFSHEASVKKLDRELLFYLQSRGFSLQYAQSFLIHGFVDVFVSKLPMEYAIEINRFLELELEGSVG
jgi:Fe-S cluster assembly protein SufB